MKINSLMFKKVLPCIVASVLVLAMLTACGSSKKTGGSESRADDIDEYITLGEYKGVEADQTKVEITEDDVDAYIDEEMTNYVEAEREAKSGDYVVVDYTVYIDGEESEDWSDEDVGMEIGQYELYAEFDDALLGAKTGDTVEVEVDFSAYDDSLADSETKCEIQVINVYEIVIEDITDDYVKENTDYETVEEYRDAVYDELYEEEYDGAVEEMKYSAWQTAMDNAVLNDYTDEMYDDQYEVFISDIQYYAEMFGYEDDVDTFMEEWGYTDDDIKTGVEEYIKQNLLCQAIAAAEGIEVSDDEYQAGLEELALEYGYDDAEAFAEDYDTEEVREYLLLEKVMSFVADNAVVTEVEAEDEDYDSE